MANRHNRHIDTFGLLLFVGRLLGLVGIEAIGAQQKPQGEVGGGLAIHIEARNIEIDDDLFRLLEIGGSGAACPQPIMRGELRGLAKADDRDAICLRTLGRQNIENAHRLCRKACHLGGLFQHASRIHMRLTRRPFVAGSAQKNGRGIFT